MYVPDGDDREFPAIDDIENEKYVFIGGRDYRLNGSESGGGEIPCFLPEIMDLNLKDRSNIGLGSITADSLATLSAASLRGMLEWAGIQMRVTLREGRLARVC